MELFRLTVLLVAGVSAAAASGISFWLIMKHQQNMTNVSVQSKIVGIVWMIPIYSIDSFLGLSLPEVADYVNMLRDCYEAYVLYLFLSLMLSYLGVEDAECEYKLVTYLEKQPSEKRSCPFNWMCGEDLPRGREFLRYCKFGTLQYCVVRPTTTIIAMLMDIGGVYHESEMDFNYGYIYILIIMNLSIGYAFVVLASFYSAMKKKLKPYEPVGKFLCIKFVIFFAFWQSVVITGFVKIGWITGLGDYNARQVSTGLQDFLICIEMFIAAVAFTYTFGFEPFTEGYVNPKLTYLYSDEYDVENAADMDYLIQASNSDLRKHSGGAAGSSNSTAPTQHQHQHHQEKQGGGKVKKATGLLNTLRNSKKVGFPFPISSTRTSSTPQQQHQQQHQQAPTSKSGGANGEGSMGSSRNYQLADMNHPKAAPSSGSTYSALHGSYIPPDQHQHLHEHEQHKPQSTSTTRAAHKADSGQSRAGFGAAGDRKHEQSVTQSAATSSSRAGELLNKHFAANSAIRDFNETMPVLVLPSGFQMHAGMVVNSDPEARLRALEEEDRRLQEQEQEQR